jgi:SAM-dependent methyltransferase
VKRTTNLAALKQSLRPFVPDILISLRKLRSLHPRTCPLCGYNGYFLHQGRPPRLDALCGRCGSLERHRLFWLWFGGERSKLCEPILHFAPEPVVRNNLSRLYSRYATADLNGEADLTLNIESIDLPSGSVNTVICNHVLEHVSDRKALAEIHRVLSPHGLLVASVPIVEGWDQTYENDSITSPLERELHFGQFDHVRVYGRDFRDRLHAAGFSTIDEVTAHGRDVVTYGLLRGEKIFVCRK